MLHWDPSDQSHVAVRGLNLLRKHGQQPGDLKNSTHKTFENTREVFHRGLALFHTSSQMLVTPQPWSRTQSCSELCCGCSLLADTFMAESHCASLDFRIRALVIHPNTASEMRCR